MPHSFRRSLLLFIGFVWMTAGCQAQATVAPAPNTPLPALFTATPPSATATLPPAPSAAPSRSLVICLGQEPGSLYAYGSSSRGMWSVLEAIYDGPIDTRQYAPQPVILQKLPTLADGDAVFKAVEVKAGDLVVDAEGALVSLAAGVRVRPAGCQGLSCVTTWDGKKALQMDRLTVTYRLLAGLKWSDGAALTAADSVYSFDLASNPATKVAKGIVDRTAAYRALDEVSVEWSGRPGYAPAGLDELFFLPLPKHAWEQYKPAEMETIDAVRRTPLGWGPYVIENWTLGDNIRLSKNPNYFRAAEGLPKFDHVVFRFLGEPGDNNLAALQAGECDLVDQTTLLEDQLEQIIELGNAKKLKAYIGQGPQWEHLDFNVQPVDNGAPNFFGDVRVRQAVAACIDRAAIIQGLYYNRSSIPLSFLPPAHPLLPAGLTALPYDVARANQLLSEAGWKDEDSNPATPRTAQGAVNVRAGTPFEVTYVTTQAAARRQTAERIAKNLADCGIKVNVQTLNPAELYAAGPQGVLFGRTYDLAQFSWEAGSQPPCFLYESSAIPNAKNSWVGGNVTGYRNTAFDTACQTARHARLDAPERVSAYQETARLFAADLPSLPLYYPVQMAISRVDFCNMSLDVSARSSLWNLERFDFNAACLP